MSATATVQFSNGDTTTVTDFSNQIGVQPRELVNVTVQFSPAPVGEPVVVDVLDGGSTSVGSSIPVIDATGIMSFAFLAPASTGTQSIGIRIGATAFALQFSVLSASQP